MTVKECREILGDQAKTMSDDDVNLYIQQAGTIADAILDIASNSLLTHNNERAYDGN
jgi:hypothetical protein